MPHLAQKKMRKVGSAVVTLFRAVAPSRVLCESSAYSAVSRAHVLTIAAEWAIHNCWTEGARKNKNPGALAPGQEEMKRASS